jgi:hypothetical protein
LKEEPQWFLLGNRATSQSVSLPFGLGDVFKNAKRLAMAYDSQHNRASEEWKVYAHPSSLSLNEKWLVILVFPKSTRMTAACSIGFHDFISLMHPPYLLPNSLTEIVLAT